MKQNYILLLLILTISSIYSNNRILIITNSDNIYDQYNTALENNRDAIPYDIELVQVDDTLSASDFSGSIEFLMNKWATPPLFSFYIDSDDQDKIMIHGFNRKSQPELEIIKKILPKLFLEQKISTEFPLYLIGIIPEKEIVKLYRDNMIPIILFEGQITPEKIIETLIEPIDTEKSSRHYFIVTMFGKTFYLGEKILLIINGVSLFIIILLLNIFSRNIKFHLKYNKKYLLTIPIKVLSIFIFYFISTLIFEHIEEIAGGSSITLQYPKTFFVLKHLILFFIYGIYFQIIKNIYISKSPYFYAYFSLYTSLIVYIVLAIIYLPLALYQVWPITLTIIYTLSRKRSVKRIMLVLTPIFMAILLVTFLTSQYESFSALILQSRYKGNIILTFFLTPYIFLQESYFRFIHKKQNKIGYSRDIMLSLLILTTIITTIAILIELH